MLCQKEGPKVQAKQGSQKSHHVSQPPRPSLPRAEVINQFGKKVIKEVRMDDGWKFWGLFPSSFIACYGISFCSPYLVFLMISSLKSVIVS